MADLSDIELDAVYEAQQAAVVRLHLYIIGEIHRLVNEVGANALKTLRSQEDAELTSIVAQQAKGQLLTDWSDFLNTYTELIGRGMRIAASFPFGVLAIQHENIVLPIVDIAESMRRKPARVAEWFEADGAPEGVFDRPLDAILNAAANRRLEDGLSVSERIWRFDNNSRRTFDKILADGVANGRSAWETAGLLENYLGSGADCPRWTRTRLYNTSKSDIAAGDTTGLFTGSECASQGVAYNALRLARNEMQTTLNIANDTLMAASPWIEGEQIVLSAEHPKPDQCDDAASGGENNDGVYPVGTITLPLHVLCLCYKLAVMMDKAVFNNKLRSWLKGGPDPAVSDYQTFIGGALSVSFMSLVAAAVLATWLFSDDLDSLFWD